MANPLFPSFFPGLLSLADGQRSCRSAPDKPEAESLSHFLFFVRIGRCTMDKLGALEKPIFFRPFQRLPFFPLACAGVFALFPSARAGQCLPIFALGCNEKGHKCLFFFKKKKQRIFSTRKGKKSDGTRAAQSSGIA